jgi:2-polyprenyl-3-methyl-5-hydroxy-6-metoxy-1,4-benzoquinol methylase
MPSLSKHLFKTGLNQVELGHSMLEILRSLQRRLTFSLAYLQNPPWDTGVSPPELLDYLNTHPAGRALDLGCGTGTNVITMAERGWQVTGVDFAHRAIQSARHKAYIAGVQADFQTGDVTRLDHINNHFDLILDIGCLHGVLQERRPAYFRGLERMLNPGGTYLLYAFWVDPGSTSKSGLDERDLAALQKFLHLENRQDGTERGRRPSTWFLFKKIAT